MRQETLRLTLLSPAFLGDAQQSGAWRAPPFKALLREWWRIAAAPSHGYNHAALREAEGALFGNAWLESANGKSRFCQSKVRLSLGHWNPGKSISFDDDPKVSHCTVKFPIGSHLYLGYGPLVIDKASKKTALKKNAALQAGETNTLALAWPDEHDAALDHTLQLIDWFGTVGGRSRNGWGSVALGLDALRSDHAQLAAVLRDLRECLQLDWPHAIGRDGKGPLIWESEQTFSGWREAMTFLAQTKIGFRTHFTLSQPTRKTRNHKISGSGYAHVTPADRHVLAYPVTHHAVYPWLNIDDKGWEKDERRFANQLRFKLFRDAAGQLRARIYHTPHACPLPMNNLDQLAVWRQVHAWLDNQTKALQRLGGQS